MADSSTSNYTRARAPFDRSDANVILLSSDNVRFYLHTYILTTASPFFAAMYALPQTNTLGPSASNNSNSNEVSEEGLPIVPVTEGSKVLDALFRFIYPIPHPSLHELADIADVLEAGRKYDVDAVTVPLESALRGFVATEPLRVYAVACRLDMEEEAKLAAEKSLEFTDDFSYVPEMRFISAGAYFRLRLYRTKRKAGEEVKESFRFVHPGLENDDVNAECTPQPDGPDSPMQDEESSPAEDDDEGPREVEPVDVRYLDVDLFDQYPADIMLCSSDGAKFRAHRFILSIASPVLAEKLKNCEDLPKFSDGLSILVLPHSEHTLGVLLQASYGQQIDVDVDMFYSVAKAAALYRMARTTLRLTYEFDFLDSSDSIRPYMIAVALGWDTQAKLAARTAAENRHCKLDVFIPEMEFSSASVYYNYLKYASDVESSRLAAVSRYDQRTLPADRYGPYTYSIRSGSDPNFPDYTRPKFSPNVFIRELIMHLPVCLTGSTASLETIVEETRQMEKEVRAAINKVELTIGPGALPDKSWAN